MMRKYFMTVAVALGSAGLGLASPASVPNFIFTSVATNQSGITQSYLAVATSGTNFVCVGSNSAAALGLTTNALPTGGYLTNASAWLPTSPGVTNLNCVTFGNGYYLAAGTANKFITLLGSGTNVWSSPTNISGTVDAQGIAFDPWGGRFVLGIASPNLYYSTSSVPQIGWTAGSLDLPSPFESFRSVAAMSSNHFAICGIRGDVRVSTSTNGLASWSVNRQINLAQPDLHGIASDGVNTLVCVGLTSNILVSVDQGSTWYTNSTPDGAAVNQSVTYTGTNDNRFLVVGANGHVYLASNNTNSLPWTWTQVSAVTNLTSQTLNAVAYAANGPFQGVALAVGNAGTILVGGTVPTAPVATNYPVTLTNLLTYPTQTNIAFAATNVPDYYHPFGSVTNDWYGSVGGNDLLSSNSPNYTATNKLCGTQSFWTQARDIRTGLTSTNRTQFNVVLLPPAPTTNTWGTITNLLSASPQVNWPVWVNILTNNGNPPANFVVKWYDAATGGTLLNNTTETNLARAFYHTPTNAVLCGIYTNWTETVATNTTPAGVNVPSTNRTPVVYVVIPPAPINALAGLTNVLTTNNSVWVDLLTNVVNPATKFTVNWYDAPTGGTLLNYGTETNLSNRFYYTPTNRVSGVYTVYAETVATNTAFNGASQISTNRTAVTYVVIPPAPYAPVGGTNWENNLPNPTLSVSELVNADNAAGRILGDWYTSIGGTLLASATNSYTPTVTARGVYTYWVQARDLVSQQVSTNWLSVKFLVVPKPVITNGPIAFEAAFVTNLLTAPLQTNGTLTKYLPDESFVLTNLPPGAAVTVDWYTNGLGINPAFGAYTGTNSSDVKWLTGGGVLAASGTTNLIVTNRLAGTYVYWAQARVTNSGFFNTGLTNNTGLSLSLQPFTFQLIPPAPTTNTWGTITNLLSASPQVNWPVWVNILTNNGNPPANFVVKWYDAATGGTLLNNTTETNLARAFYHTPTNAVLCGIYTNWTETVATNTTPAGVNVPSTNRTPVVYVVIPPAPINALAGLTNVLTTNNSVWVDLLTNVVNPATKFTVNWYDAPTGGTLLNYGTETNLSNRFYYTPTNRVSGVYTVYAETVATNTAFNGASQISTNRTAVTYVVIPPAPYAPVGGTNWENNLPNPTLSVSELVNADNAAGRILGDWYTSIGGTLLASATNSYTPTVTARGVYTYWVQARDLVSQQVSTNWLSVKFLVVPKPVITNGPIAFEAAFVTNLLTAPLQTNGTLTKYLPDESFVLTNLPPGAAVTVDWYADSSGSTPSYTATNSADTNWLSGGGVIVATGTTNFIATNRLAGTYVYWAQARVTNPGFANPGLSTSLQPFVFKVIPPAPPAAVTGLTNVLTLDPQTNLPVWVTILTNIDNPPANFVVDWYDAAVNGNLLNNSQETNLANRFYHGLTNQISGAYTIYAATRATNTSPAGTDLTSTNRTPVTFVLIPPAPVNAQLNWTNVLTVNNSVWVEVLTNLHNAADSFRVEWYDAATGGNDLGTATNLADYFYYTPTNIVCGVYTVYAATIATNTPDGNPQISTNRIALTYAVIPPAPANPTGATNWEDNLPNPALTVSVYSDANNPAGTITADWYDGAATKVAAGTTAFAPTNTLAASYAYSAVARDVSSGLMSTNQVSATLVLKTYVPIITLSAGSGDIKWVGGYTLQSTTNLTPPVVWVDVTNGVAGTNDWSYTTTNADAMYYQLKPN